MVTEHAEAYLEDPKYSKAMADFQTGKWEAGLSELEALQKEYPLTPELRHLRQEMLLRSRIDQNEIEDRKQELRELAGRMVLWLAILVGVMGVLYWGFTNYSSWIQEQWSITQQNLRSDIQMIEAAISIRDAEGLLAANRPEDAMEIISELQSENEYPEQVAALAQRAEDMLATKAQYSAAIALLDTGEEGAALAALKEINQEYPNYLDVPELISEIEAETLLSARLATADANFAAGNWEQAAAEYEEISTTHPNYERAWVTEQLLASYMNIAYSILESGSDTPESLADADVYFRKALALKPRDEALLAEQYLAKEEFRNRLFQYLVDKARNAVVAQEDSLMALSISNGYLRDALLLKPDNQEVIDELNKANAYLQAQTDFENGNLDDAILNLEFVYDLERGYASGTALQTLYDAYMARGDIRTVTGEYELALEDYQSAAEIALLTNDPELKVYFVKVKIAETFGALGDYSTAVSNYQDAAQMVDLQTLAEASDAQLAYLISEADRYAGIEWFRTSFRLFQRFMPAQDLVLESVIVTAQEGDYITSLANRHHTTVKAILDANNLLDIKNLKPGQAITIPTLKTEE